MIIPSNSNYPIFPSFEPEPDSNQQSEKSIEEQITQATTPILTRQPSSATLPALKGNAENSETISPNTS